MTITAAAPSLIPDAFPAVTVPSFENAGRRLAKESILVVCLGNSSLSKIMSSPLRCGIDIGVISSRNKSDF